MVLFTLITISLDASACIAWWAVKNTLYGTYSIGHYLIARPTIIQKTKEEELIIELKTSLMHELAELNNKIINSHNMNPHNMNPHIINRTDIHYIETIPGPFVPLNILNEQINEPLVDNMTEPINEILNDILFQYVEIQNELYDDFIIIGRE
jgi:hypothetical protein